VGKFSSVGKDTHLEKWLDSDIGEGAGWYEIVI
jgi:hypothetical protein